MSTEMEVFPQEEMQEVLDALAEDIEETTRDQGTPEAIAMPAPPSAPPSATAVDLLPNVSRAPRSSPPAHGIPVSWNRFELLADVDRSSQGTNASMHNPANSAKQRAGGFHDPPSPSPYGRDTKRRHTGDGLGEVARHHTSLFALPPIPSTSTPLDSPNVFRTAPAHHASLGLAQWAAIPDEQRGPAPAAVIRLDNIPANALAAPPQQHNQGALLVQPIALANPGEVLVAPIAGPLDLYAAVHFADTEGHFASTELAQLNTWRGIDGGKVIVHVAHLGYPQPRLANEQMELVLRLFKQATGVTSARASAPFPSEVTRGSNKAPFGTLVFGISKQVEGMACGRQVYNLADGTLFVYRLDHIFQTYYTSIVYWTTSTATGAEILEGVNRCFNRAHIDARIMQLVSTNAAWAHMSPHNATAAVRNSLRIEIIDSRGPGNTAAPTVNIFFAAAPTQNPLQWRSFASFIRSINYVDHLLGAGQVKSPPMECGLCHGCSHPTGLCPFPQVPGWISPPQAPAAPATAGQANDVLAGAVQGNANARGGRGRGNGTRGRGRGGRGSS